MKDVNLLDISVVVPVYNNANGIAPLCSAVYEALSNKKFELILVDDGSIDQSWLTIKDIAKKFPFVKGYKLSENNGQHVATLCGITQSSGEWIAILDDDLQFSPNDILSLIESGEKENASLVYGIPKNKKHQFGRNLGSKLLSAILKKHGGLKTTGSSFKVIHSDLRKEILAFQHPFLFLDEVLQWNAHHITKVDVDHKERENGKSTYSFWKLISLSTNYILRYTTLPLKLIAYFGSITFLICLGFILFFLYQKFTYGAELGFTALIISIFMSTGLIMFSLGVIGEYLNRLFLMQSQKPLYKIKEQL